MRKIGCILVIMILIIVTLTGCNKKNSLYEDMNLSNDEIFLYSVVDERLGIYNTKEFTWKPLYDEENTFQYVFNNDSEYVVSGNSIDNGFVLLERSADRKSLKKLFELNNDKNCFFPLATNGNQYYFVMYIDEKSEFVDRVIFTFKKDFEMQNILESNEMITAGVMLDNILYYTAYNELTDNYYLFSLNMLDIEKGSINLNTELQTRDLFCYKENICVSDYDNIYIDSMKIPKEYINFIEQDYIIQFYSNRCTVKNISSGDSLGAFLNPINYEVIDDQIIIYCQTGIYNIGM